MRPAAYISVFLRKNGKIAHNFPSAREKRKAGKRMLLDDNPIIAAVRTPKELAVALEAPVQIIFLLNGSILTLREDIRRTHTLGKLLFLHIDLAEGVGKDNAGIGHLAKMGVDGIISTRTNLIRIAKEWGLHTVQRFFIVDSHSVDTAIEAIHTCEPSMAELMPGVVTKVIRRFCQKVDMPVIAGGMIETKEEIIQAINAGAAAISTARRELWQE